MSSPVQNTKRRRLNNSTSLPKFKSPVKRSFENNSDQPVPNERDRSAGPVKRQFDAELPKGIDTPPVSDVSGVTRQQIPVRTSFKASSAAQDPELRAIRALESSIRAIKDDVDLLSQAVRIIKVGRDAELEKLIVKWKLISREAAEELYATCKDKVNRMGGMQAWRDMEKQRKEQNRGWDETEDVADDEQEEDEGKAEELRLAKEAGVSIRCI